MVLSFVLHITPMSESRATVDIGLVRKFPSQDIPHDIDLGVVNNILIREFEPQTPQIQWQALKDIQLLSPPANYEMKNLQPTQSEGPRRLEYYSLQHKSTDRE